MINLHALMLFYNVALTGSVTEASKRLNISQPAISAQIRNFEKQYNIILFEKKGRSLVLTPFGQKLLKPTEKLFLLEEQIESMIEDYHKHPQGKLRISGNYLATSFLIPKWASLFKQRYPQVEVEITTVNSQAALEKLTNYESDIAIFGSSEITNHNEPHLHFMELYQNEFKFVVAPNHKYANRQISLEDMVKEPFIMREEGSATRKKLIEVCDLQAVRLPKIELQFNGINEIIQAVVAGYGVSFVSSLVASPFIERGELAIVDVIDVRITNNIVLCSHDRGVLESYIRDFISIAKTVKEAEE
ncbi:LysR family transcriptional regulator [Paenibacillus radicis (ex Gao et al. 2016)]|uniref:LysR family transcriptional regulator n=1 Tax=Paenibacillus radicis (ex Gao et al. 2016) TaxID=1737354 RepID=A0A917M0K7_9BACL|nr:LysR family transcriptional regulator [Paenibacillus radicis (ex Gao et al. 2016)]GGG69659.1 LysR family transcriptional regulator [Paenibacillus radicis (ex Gao et al. 2016)]